MPVDIDSRCCEGWNLRVGPMSPILDNARLPPYLARPDRNHGPRYIDCGLDQAETQSHGHGHAVKSVYFSAWLPV
ncbi:hypothetical protein RRG08_006774 [Elysia crispata]|uniref:Uncharacterized protein n=1 Tax=Elysia crispata TaxID=231223 RepID=A0AAE0YBD3_9GAST|nr:hypothetical protein RRG08_006774 [Elysia crispata]